MSWKNKETYEKRIAKTFFSLAEEMAEEEIKRLKLENQKLREQLLLHNVSASTTVKELHVALKNLLQATDDEGWHNDGKDWEEQARKALKNTSRMYLR